MVPLRNERINRNGMQWVNEWMNEMLIIMISTKLK